MLHLISIIILFYCLIFVGIYDGQCAYYQPWMLSAVCGVILVPYSSFLTFCATCGWVSLICTSYSMDTLLFIISTTLHLMIRTLIILKYFFKEYFMNSMVCRFIELFPLIQHFHFFIFSFSMFVAIYLSFFFFI